MGAKSDSRGRPVNYNRLHQSCNFSLPFFPHFRFSRGSGFVAWFSLEWQYILNRAARSETVSGPDNFKMYLLLLENIKIKEKVRIIFLGTYIITYCRYCIHKTFKTMHIEWMRLCRRWWIIQPCTWSKIPGNRKMIIVWNF